SSAGANPPNDSEVLPSYRPVTGFTRWAVPVLPATRQPGTCARGATPSSGSTTFSIIFAVARAASLLITRVRVATSVPTVTPSSVTADPEIRLGDTRTPPLATVFTAAAICATLTDSDWPKATR